MPTIHVRVLHNGKPAHRVRVVLEYATGMSPAVTTDADGCAEFNADNGQEGLIFVDGRNVGHWGSYTASDITINI